MLQSDMQFDIITLFPKQMEAIFNESILKRGQQSGKIQINIHDLRKWTADERKTVDDRPFGGGPGMLMMVEPIYKALKELGVHTRYTNKADFIEQPISKTKVILTSARGETWNQNTAKKYSGEIERLVIICGHYEGVDHRVVEHLVDAEVSIGNYVLTGGELPAGVIVDSIARLVPGVLGNEESLKEESHSFLEDNSKEYPQYTRPATFVTEEGDEWTVPDVLLSGNHAEIKKWQQQATQ